MGKNRALRTDLLSFMDDDNDDEVGWGLASDEKEAKEDIFWDQKWRSLGERVHLFNSGTLLHVMQFL